MAEQSHANYRGNSFTKTRHNSTGKKELSGRNFYWFWTDCGICLVVRNNRLSLVHEHLQQMHVKPMTQTNDKIGRYYPPIFSAKLEPSSAAKFYFIADNIGR